MIKKSILIIDDDIILLKTAEEILSDLYSVSVAKGGKQGITLLKKGIIPNLILLDIAMPVSYTHLGQRAKELWVDLELKVIADVGLIGFQMCIRDRT